MSFGQYSFLSWARRGIGGSVVDLDPLGASGLPIRPTIPLTLEVNSLRIDHAATLRGPGDVIGLDPRAIVRTDPQPGVTDFEPNFLACIELYDEDLPWRYTPARATPEHRLRPWIALVVLAENEFQRDGTAITVAAANTLFPPTSQVWAWAHVHVNATVSAPASLDTTVHANPDLALARLLCPRRLAPNTAYTAFIIPTFELGRLAALGLDVPQQVDGNTPAWGAAQTRFPVYYEWSFRTGAAGDFESLARLLVPRTLDSRVGTRDMDVQAPGLIDGITAPPLLGLEGALRTPQTEPTTWPLQGETFADRLAAVIDAGAAVGSDPTVTPPFYGQWQAACAKMAASTNPPWITTLNRDPRHRAAAGFGAEVIRQAQDELMTAAWRQAGAIEDANRALVLAQLARATLRSAFTRHFASLDGNRLLAICSPLQARLKSGALTLRERIRRSTVPGAVLDRSFRRITRSAGAVSRRFFRTAPTARWVARLDRGEITASPPKTVPVHALLVDALDQAALASAPHAVMRTVRVLGRDVGAIPSRPAFHVTDPGQVLTATSITGVDSAEAARFRGALTTLHGELSAEPPPPAPAPMLGVDAVRSDLIVALEPGAGLARRVLGRLQVSGLDLASRPDPLDRIMMAPEIDRPMYAPLADISQDLLLPRLDLVPQNTVSLLLTNARFVEAYMVGLNHEMSRELLWREFPTDQRGTYFRCFWDSRDSLAAAPTRDIDAIHLWPHDSDLGGHVAGGDGRLVLLVRGDILKKYPSSVVTAVNAVWPQGGGKRLLGTEERYPLFHAELAPDLTFIGFDLDLAQAKGNDDPAADDAGWFFVIKQRPGEPRFGLDVTSETATATSWDELSWQNVVASPNLDLDPALHDADIPDHQRWGRTAADMASILYQRPVLIALHASEMLP
jgi:hypothetical protein